MNSLQCYELQEARKIITSKHKSEKLFHTQFLRPNPRSTESEETLRGIFYNWQQHKLCG